MSKSTLKMTYIAAQYRVRVEFSKQDALLDLLPPKDLMLRAEKRLQKESQGGHIAFFHSYESRLLAVWKKLREADEDPKTRVAVTLVSASPPMSGVSLTPSSDADKKDRGILAFLSLSSSRAEISTWGFRPLKLNIVDQLMKLGVAEKVDAAHVHAAWIKAVQGEEIKRFPLYAPPKIPDVSENYYEIIRREEFGELLLVVYNVRALLEEHLLLELVDRIKIEIKKLTPKPGSTFKLLYEDVIREMRSSFRGPERLGVDLPSLHLVALELKILSPAKKAVSASEPYLFETYKNIEANSQLSVREKQQRSIVKKGKVIAEFRFQKAGADGYDELGHVIKAPLPSVPDFLLGDFVEKVGLTFIAKEDGIPEISANKITLARVLVIEGSVNLSTGHINFAGSVEIHGDIEEGSEVRVGKDLIVHGMVVGGIIEVKGNVTIDGGINNHYKGYISVGGNLNVHFIANASVKCAGDITVRKDILNSRVFAHKNIFNNGPNCHILGGLLMCYEDLKCTNLGRAEGVITQLKIGYDYLVEDRISHLKKRLEKLYLFMDDLKKKQDFYRAKLPAQKSERKLKHEENILKSKNKCEKIMDELKSRMTKREASRIYNEKSQIYVSEKLSRTCKIDIAGRVIAVKDEIAHVLISKDLKGGANFSALP